MRSVILVVLVILGCGTVQAAQAAAISGAPQPPTVHTPTVSIPAVVPPQVPVVPQPELYLPSSSINLTQVWLHSPAARMYWNGVPHPTQINMGVGSFRDPALVSPLFPEQKPRARGPRRARSGSTATASKACACKAVCPCVANKCVCATGGKPPSPSVTGRSVGGQTEGAQAAPAKPSVQQQAAAVPPLPAPAVSAIPPVPPAAAAVPAVPVPRPPAIPKTPSPLQ